MDERECILMAASRLVLCIVPLSISRKFAKISRFFGHPYTKIRNALRALFLNGRVATGSTHHLATLTMYGE